MISARVLGGAHSGGGLDWKDFSSNYEADRDLVVVLICIQLPDWSLFPPPIVWRISSQRHRFPLCYSRFPRVPFFFAEMLAVSHLLLINTIIASLSHPVLGSSLLGLDQQQRQTLRDRLFQTNLRGPRWSTQFILWYMRKIEGDIPAGNDNQNVLLDLVTGSMDLAGLKTETLDYTLNRSVLSNFHISSSDWEFVAFVSILLDGILDGGRWIFNLRTEQIYQFRQRAFGHIAVTAVWPVSRHRYMTRERTVWVQSREPIRVRWIWRTFLREEASYSSTILVRREIILCPDIMCLGEYMRPFSIETD